MGCLFLIPGAFPRCWGHLCLLWTHLEHLKWGSGAPKSTLNQHWSPAGGTGPTEVLVHLVWIPAVLEFLFTLPSRNSSASPKTQHIKLEMFCETLSSFGGKGRWYPGQKHFVSSVSKQYFPFPMAIFFCGFKHFHSVL